MTKYPPKSEHRTTQQARDEFIDLRASDPDFAKQYSADDFQAWLDDYQIGLDD